MKKIALFASHNGSIFDTIYNVTNINISLIITNNSDANILLKAKKFNIPFYVINEKNTQNVDKRIIELLDIHNIDFILLAGYMKKISSSIIDKYNIINSHPSLLPSYGGSGMYGKFVHEAVIKNNEKVSGVTIHEVDKVYDSGKIILQKEVVLDTNETVESLEKKIKELEKIAIVEAIELYKI